MPKNETKKEWSLHECFGYPYPDAGRAEYSLDQPVAFSLPHMLFAVGLLESQPLDHFTNLRRAVRSRWKNPTRHDGFWLDLRRRRVSPKSLAADADNQDEYLVGIWWNLNLKNAHYTGLPFNTSIKQTLMVLSRIRGSIFVPSADPDYSWDNLLKGVFVLRWSQFRGRRAVCEQHGYRWRSGKWRFEN